MLDYAPTLGIVYICGLIVGLSIQAVRRIMYMMVARRDGGLLD